MKVCPVCEGYTASSNVRCEGCDAPLVRVDEVAWARRDDEAVGSPWVGLVIGGKYRITGVLGKGGMGTVYRAVHELSLSPVAIKVLHPRFARRAAFKETLVAEARKASLLRSEHVARVVDAGETPEGSVFIAMELVAGRTLHEWVVESGRLSVPVVVDLMLQLCDALESAHTAGIVHRDLSSKNVLLELGEHAFRAKVLDFGISRGLVRESSRDSNTVGRWVNPPYTAPEILRGQSFDQRADLYSLGIVAYEALGGALPSRATTPEDRVRAIEDFEPEPIRGAPKRLSRLLGRLMANDPAARPRRVAEVREELQRFRRPHSTRFQIAAVLALILGSTAFLTGLATERRPAFQVGSGSALAIEPARRPGEAAQYIERDKLESLVFRVKEVEPEDLLVRGFVGRNLRFAWSLGGRLDGAELRVDAARDPGWRSVLDECAGLAEEVDLDFVHEPTGLLVGHARVFVDVRAPELHATGRVPSTLRIGSKLELELSEDGRVEKVELALRRGDVELARVEVPPWSGTRDVDVADRLQAALRPRPVLDQLERVELVWSLVDAAGRSGELVQRFKKIDLSIPKIEALSAPDGGTTLWTDRGRTRLRLRLDRPEAALAGIELEIRPHDRGTTRVPREDLTIDERFVSFDLQVNETSSRELDLALRVVDEVGNASERFAQKFALRSLELDPSFVLRTKTVHRFDDETLYAPAEQALTLEYRCSADYVPSASFANRASAPVVVSSNEGLLVVELDPLVARERRELVFAHVPRGEPKAIRTVTKLQIVAISRPPAIRLEPRWLSGRLGSQDLQAASAIQVATDRQKASFGAAIEFVESPRSEVRASVWQHVQGRWVATTTTPLRIEGRADLRALEFSLSEGRNRVAIELTDVLGRPSVGGRRIRVDEGSAQLAFDFVHDLTAPELRPVEVEFGRPCVLRFFESFLPTRVSLKAAGREWRGRVAARAGGGAECRFVLSFADVQELCSWTEIGADAFVRLDARRTDLKFGTNAGEFVVPVSFAPTRTRLRPCKLSQLSRLAPAKSSSLAAAAAIQMVPVLAPPSEARIELGPPPGLDTRGSLRLEPGVVVSGLRDYFLAANEVSRGAWRAFLEDIVRARKERSLDIAALTHLEDPMGPDRLSREGLLPDRSVFGGQNFRVFVAKAPARPVTGVSYFQAHAFARWLGWRFFGDANLFRLPFGAELEFAATGGSPGRLNGLRFRGREELADWRRRFAAIQRGSLRDGVVDAARWPLTAVELGVLGDVSRSLGATITGLDFGVREWVEDLPLIGNAEAYRVVAEGHPKHLEYSRRRRVDADLRPARSRLLDIGELRGLGWGEPAVLGQDPRVGLIDARGRRSAKGILGVKRMNYARRDGKGLGRGALAPLVRVAGFRLAADTSFAALVRERL